MSQHIQIESDLFLNEGKDYWKFKCVVEFRKGEPYDTEIIWAKGAGPDDESLDLDEYVEDCINELAETRAALQFNDVLTS